MKTRCSWVKNTFWEIAYHDREWGVPTRDDHTLFEFLLLEGAQAGLSWTTILNKRENYRQAFADFDPVKIAQYGASKQRELRDNQGIVRNRLKIEAAVTNARQFLAVQSEFGSFAAYLWQFANGEPIQNYWKNLAEVPAQTPESQSLSRDLKKRGFKFVGPTICYAFMQAVGLVNDHTTDCFRHRELLESARHRSPARAS
jgi:DNA-3-methyladenine glycosylase I